MMWPFSRKARPESDEIRRARAAIARADTAGQAVDRRAQEVDLYYVRLQKRRLENNFGPALDRAIERRKNAESSA